MPVAVDRLVPFLAASVLITLVPGADMALVTRQALAGGRAPAQRTVFGNLVGLVVHGVALAVGVSALLAASATAFTVVKIVGAAYLCVLGLQSLRAGRRPSAPSADAAAVVRSRRAAFLQGLLSTVLNPKPALFFLTFVPQFIDPERAALPQAATLTALHIAVGAVWLSLYAWLVARAHSMLLRPRVTQWLERTTGTVLIALSLRVAIERR